MAQGGSQLVLCRISSKQVVSYCFEEMSAKFELRRIDNLGMATLVLDEGGRKWLKRLQPILDIFGSDLTLSTSD